jgi:hypothetical protein
MDVKFKKVCPICRGTQVYRRLECEIEEGDHNWSMHESPCKCIETDDPGYEVVGFIDTSDLADTVADILSKVNDIKEKLDEM